MNIISPKFLRTIFPPKTDNKQLTSVSPSYEVDLVAAYNSFVKHWQDIAQIFEETGFRKVTTDDVTAVRIISDQMINLLVIDLRRMTSNGSPINGATANNITPPTPIFDHFLGERILQKILQWSVLLTSKEFLSVLQLHQLKIYETLLSNSHPEILVYKPITEPLLMLLESCSECSQLEVEKRLVVLLNQLWVSVIHNQHLLKYFLLFYEDRPPKFVIFSLLLPFIHREGGVGQQARDALLLSMSLSASHYGVAEFIIRHSDFCPVVGTGLSGLYSKLPRSLTITTEGWYRLSPNDVACIPSLQRFLNSLEFCNATVQGSHLQIQQQLIDFLYHGFLIPVVGRALIQNVIEEQIAAIAYIDFFLRSVTEEKLRRAFLALLLSPQEYSKLPLLTSIISHLHSPVVQLNLVTLNLFNTLLRLHSEDVMTVLVFQYLAPCNHVMLSQRSKLSQPPFTAADRFLRLLPNVCQVESLSTSPSSKMGTTTTNQSSFSVYLEEARAKVESSYNACKSWTWSYDAQSPLPTEAVQLINASKIIPVIPYTKLRVQSDPCSHSLPYENDNTGPGTVKKRSSSLPTFSIKDSGSQSSSKERNTGTLVARGGWNSQTVHLNEEERLDSLGESSGYESINPKNSGNSGNSSPLHATRSRNRSDKRCPDRSSRDEEAETVEEFLTFLNNQTQTQSTCSSQDDDPLQLIDYFFCAIEGPHTSRKSESLQNAGQEDLELQNQWLSVSLTSTEEDSNEDKENSICSHPKPTIGPFLEGLISQLDNMFTSNVDSTLVAMSCLSCLASYPCPLLISLLLQPSVVLQPAVRSLYQVLGRLKHNIDKVLTSQDDLPALIDARARFHGSFKSDIKKPVTPNPVTTGWNFFKKKGGILPTGSGYHYVSPTQDAPSPFLNVSLEKRQATICAVLLKEWLLELAALAQEHTVYSPVIDFRCLSTHS